ncbi:MAG: ROK family protein [Paracoccaceae bacterium]
MALAGGIDLGGTKIEATLFDADWQPIESQRIATPRASYDDMLDALASQTRWIIEHANQIDLPIGIGVPGRIDPETGLSFTANLPASGHPMRDDLRAAVGRHIYFGNDCDLFTYSEAVLGAGVPFETVFGLILGTGIGGGICHGDTLYQTRNGASGEVGHLPISAELAREFDLPLITCGCGRPGCYETLGAGPGLKRLAQHLTGQTAQPIDIAAAARAGDTDANRTMHIWSRIIAELIGGLQRTIDPDCVVLGGGLSNIPGICDLITAQLPDALLPGTTPPLVTPAKYGDSSGTRGAALAALRERQKK